MTAIELNPVRYKIDHGNNPKISEFPHYIVRYNLDDKTVWVVEAYGPTWMVNGPRGYCWSSGGVWDNNILKFDTIQEAFDKWFRIHITTNIKLTDEERKNLVKKGLTNPE